MALDFFGEHRYSKSSKKQPNMAQTFFQFSRLSNGIPYLVTVLEVNDQVKAMAPQLVTVEIPYTAREDGLPASGELSKALRVEGAIISLLGSDFLYLGHITHAGKVKVAFHSSRPASPSLTVKTGFLQKQTVLLETRLDPQWLWFESNMAPSSVEKEIGRNQELARTLAQHGDDPSKEREIDFFAHFGAKQNALTFVNQVITCGFILDPAGISETDDQPYPFTVSLKKPGKTEPYALAEACAYLRSEAEAQQGIFDGWGCGVVK